MSFKKTIRGLASGGKLLFSQMRFHSNSCDCASALLTLEAAATGVLCENGRHFRPK